MTNESIRNNLRRGPLAQQISRTMRRVREGQRMTYVEMIQRLKDIGHPLPILALRRIETGERRLDIDEIHAIARVLGVRPESLWTVPRCDACLGTPPAGYSCNACGTAATSATKEI